VLPILLSVVPVAVATTPTPTAGPSVEGQSVKTTVAVSAEQRKHADAGVAESLLLGNLKARSTDGGMHLEAEGPWTDGYGNSLGVARQYRFAEAMDTTQETWPLVEFLDAKSTKFKRHSMKMRVLGLRRITVLVDNEGTVVDVQATERDGLRDVDAPGLARTGVHDR
jgi:hypothetical protein